MDDDTSAEIKLAQNDLKITSGLVKKLDGKFNYQEISNDKSKIDISFKEFEFKGVIDALFILSDLDKTPFYRGHISPTFNTQFTSSFKNAISFLENKRVKTIVFDNSIEESQEKIDFIQQIYNDFKDISVIYLEKNEVISQKLFQAIDDEVRKSLVKKITSSFFDFVLKDVLIIDDLSEIKNIEENFKNVMKNFDIVFVKSIESIKNQLIKRFLNWLLLILHISVKRVKCS